jgi:hypothetical protein
MAECFGKTLESTFQLETDRFKHHHEVKSLKIKNQKREKKK